MKTTVHNLYPKYIQSIPNHKHCRNIIEEKLRAFNDIKIIQVQTIPSLISNTDLDHLGTHIWTIKRESFILGFPIWSPKVASLSHLGARKTSERQLTSLWELGFWMRFFSNAAVVQHLVKNLASSFAGMVANIGKQRRFTRKREASDVIFWMSQTPVSREFLRGSQCKTCTSSFWGLHVAFSKTPHFQWIQPSPIFSEATELPSTSAAHCTSLTAGPGTLLTPFLDHRLGTSRPWEP